jgi:hypothetical protein
MAKEIPLYEIPKNIEIARILDDSALEKYIGYVKSKYNSEKARSTLLRFNSSNNELTGSNPFMLVCLQNSGLLSVNSRIATRQDLEKAIHYNKGNPFSENYVDFGLALRTNKDTHTSNDLLAKVLAEELKQRGIKLGKLIPISALNLKENSNSAYGLVFSLKEDVKELEDLNNFKWNYKRDNGIARAYFYGDGYWISNVEKLADSNGNGRVVVISGEATQKNFIDFVNRYYSNKQKEFNEKVESAKGILDSASEKAKNLFS